MWYYWLIGIIVTCYLGVGTFILILSISAGKGFTKREMVEFVVTWLFTGD